VLAILSSGNRPCRQWGFVKAVIGMMPMRTACTGLTKKSVSECIRLQGKQYFIREQRWEHHPQA
jgi:hypothetical protein